jgi:hypothetical protein
MIAASKQRSVIMQFLDQIPLNLVIAACLTLGLAPFVPGPHIWEKLKMLMAGDLVLHSAPFAVLAAKLVPLALSTA